LIVRNLLYKDGYKDIILLKILQEETENYQQLENNVNKAIEKVKPENYKNYFEHAYNLNEGIKLHRKPSTRRRKLKNYK